MDKIKVYQKIYQFPDFTRNFMDLEGVEKIPEIHKADFRWIFIWKMKNYSQFERGKVKDMILKRIIESEQKGKP